MTDKPKFLLEIDGERVEVTGIYPRTRFFPYDGVGYIYGEDENTGTKEGGFMIPKNPPVAVVSVYRDNPDGSRWGIKGIFRNGQWAAGDNDMPLFRVWDRLA